MISPLMCSQLLSARPGLPAAPPELLRVLLAVGAVTLLLALLVALIQNARLQARLRVNIRNTGNAGSRYELTARAPATGMRFEYFLDGHRLPTQTHMELVAPTAGASGVGQGEGAWAQTPTVAPGATMALDVAVRSGRSFRGGRQTVAVLSRALEAPKQTLLEEQTAVRLASGGRARRFLPSFIMLALGAAVILWLWNAGGVPVLFR